MNEILTKYRSFWICMVLTFATAAVYYQVCTYDFINLDDTACILENPNIQAGITLETIKWAFLNNDWCMWHPLTWFSHTLDWQFFGSNAGGHHLTSLIFHIANTLLLFYVLKQMTKAIWPSAFVAALFALHPLHVESVAWVFERKDVLSTFFWLLTMWAYVRFVRRQKIANYLLIVIFFALGLMAKPMLVTLPFVLLLLDYWPLDRFNAKQSLPHLLIEKIPLFAMAIALSIITFIVQKKGGAMDEGDKYSFSVRLANASISYIQYIIKMIWPAKLTVFYPHPGWDVSIPYAVISAVFLLAVTILILLFSKNRRYLVTGWFWYLGTLVPVIGLVQVGQQGFADHYSYITLTGLFIIIAWGFPKLIARWPHRKAALWASSLAVLFVLAVLAHLQLRYWKDSMTLFQHALKVTNDNYRAHACIGDVLLKQDKLAEAISHYNRALQIAPNFVGVRFNLGGALVKGGKFAEAAKEYEKVLLVLPQAADAHNNLGSVLCQQGKFDEAIEHFNQAIRIAPNYTIARDNLSIALDKKQKLQDKGTENIGK